MDLDGDGIPDLISGSYDPGELYLFRGLGGGKFAAREPITDKAGKPILRRPQQTQKWESFGTWPVVVDWNGDGLPDLLIGGYEGEIFVRLNEGTRTRPAFATTNLVVMADGKPLKVPEGHATPAIADWDGDGLWDILSGSANGGVYWYRNVGKPGAPAFAAPVTLVPPHEGNGYSEWLDDTAPARPGIRSQIFVADVNGDGKLDLLLGDFRSTVSPKPDLTPAQREELRALRAKREHTQAEFRKHRTRIDAELDKFIKSMPREEMVKEENQEKWRKMSKALFDAPEVKALLTTLEELDRAQTPFLAKPAWRSFSEKDTDTAHGHVWLFLRK